MIEDQPSPSVLDGDGLTVDEAAKTLGVKRSAVRKAIARGTLAARLAPTKYGGERGGYYIAPDEIERYRAAHRRAPK